MNPSNGCASSPHRSHCAPRDHWVSPSSLPHLAVPHSAEPCAGAADASASLSSAAWVRRKLQASVAVQEPPGEASLQSWTLDSLTRADASSHMSSIRPGAMTHSSTHPLSLFLQAANRTDSALCRSAATKFVHTATATASARRGTQRGRCGSRRDKTPAAHVALGILPSKSVSTTTIETFVMSLLPLCFGILRCPRCSRLVFLPGEFTLGTAPRCLTQSHPPFHPIVIVSA
jgi:hypothetical protein